MVVRKNRLSAFAALPKQLIFSAVKKSAVPELPRVPRFAWGRFSPKLGLNRPQYLFSLLSFLYFLVLGCGPYASAKAIFVLQRRRIHKRML